MATTNFNNDIIVTETLIVSSSVGIGATSLTGYNLLASKNITGATTAYGISSGGTVQSDVTGQANYFISSVSTAATTFTLPNLYHYRTFQGTFGAGSTVTNQFAFFANSNLIGATNNYGFYGAIGAGSNRWNIYMDGTADNYLAGSLGIGSTNLTGINLRITKNITGLTTSYGILQDPTIQSGVTTATYMNRSLPSTVAASFTLSNLYHFAATQGTIGAGSTVTNQYGFLAESNLTGATNNYGFFGNIPASTGDWNLFMNGNADNFLSGSLGIGNGKSVPTAKLDINGNTLISGSLIVSSSAVAASLQGSGSGVFTVDGTVGRLFSVDDSLTGSLFSVNTSAGLPVIEAFSNNTVRIGQYGQQALFVSQSRVGIGKENALNGILDVSGSTTLTGSLSVTGSTSLSGPLYISANPNGWTANVVNNKSLTGATSTYAYVADNTIQSDVTNNVGFYRTQPATAASSFTVATLSHFHATQGTFGVGSTVTDQRGFWAGSSIVGAAFNYGFRGQVPASGSSNWNLYMDGTANNYLAGSLGIGNTSLTARSFVVTLVGTGATTYFGINQNGQVQSDVTLQMVGFNNTSNIAAATFTLSEYTHYRAIQGTFGAGSTVTAQTGYRVDANLIGATNNYGYYGDIPSGTNRWNLYMNGTANNYLAGSLGIGATALTGINLYVGKNITGATTAYGVVQNGTVQSGVTSTVYSFVSSINTAASAFTLGNYYHFYAAQNTIGATSAVTNQYGFIVENTLIGATNNYAFFGNIPSGTNRWNLYMAGTASNYMAGALGIGGTSLSNTNLTFNKTITGAVTSYGIFGTSIVGADVTTSARYYATSVSTAASAFTLTDLVHYYAGQGTFGATSTVTNQYGFFVQSSLQSATNNYGFYGNIPSGANRWNLYMAGTAANYMAGNLGLGTITPATSAKLTIMGNLTFGLPGNGSNTSGRFISIEGNTDASGEGSSRIFFAEHNSSTAAMDSYGMSLGYRGGDTTIVGASGNTWNGLSLISNGEWGMWGHDNNSTGSLIMYGDRVATFINLSNNNLNNVGDAYFNGNVSIGKVTPTTKLDVNGNVLVTGSISATADITAYSTSDINFKENIQYIPNALEKLDKIGGYTFDWKNDEELVSLHNFRGHDIGVIAQEIEEVLPEVVATRDNGYKAVKYEKLSAYLIQVDKEQQQIIKDQQRQIDELRELINELKNK